MVYARSCFCYCGIPTIASREPRAVNSSHAARTFITSVSDLRCDPYTAWRHGKNSDCPELESIPDRGDVHVNLALAAVVESHPARGGSARQSNAARVVEMRARAGQCARFPSRATC